MPVRRTMLETNWTEKLGPVYVLCRWPLSFRGSGLTYGRRRADSFVYVTQQISRIRPLLGAQEENLTLRDRDAELPSDAAA